MWLTHNQWDLGKSCDTKTSYCPTKYTVNYFSQDDFIPTSRHTTYGLRKINRMYGTLSEDIKCLEKSCNLDEIDVLYQLNHFSYYCKTS